MSETAATVLVESGLKQAVSGAEGLAGMARRLEASGPWLKLAVTSPVASDAVCNFRISMSIAARTRGSAITAEGYQVVRAQLLDVLKDNRVSAELRQTIELEIRRADAVILEGARTAARVSKLPRMALADMTPEVEAVLSAFAKRMNDSAAPPEARAVYAQLVAQLPVSDPGWAAMGAVAVDRAKRVRARFPDLTREDVAQNPTAEQLVGQAYTAHGKGEVFEHFARTTEYVRNDVNGELRAAAHRAGTMGFEARAVLSEGELRLGTTVKSGDVGGWKKFADTGVLIVDESSAAKLTVAADASGKVPIAGTAQPSALWEFKAEEGLSDLANQQERALPRMLSRWERGEPIYVAMNVTDEAGATATKVYLLLPPDSKAGLSYYGAGTSNAVIENRAVLAQQGADVRNTNIGVSNNDLRSLWLELFWVAFKAK